jgi:hypothetical protein
MRELQSVHATPHNDVGEYHSDIVAAREEADSFVCALRRERLEAGVGDNFQSVCQDQRLVLDDEED